MTTAVIDANVLVGLLDERDKWHGMAVAIRDALDAANVNVVYFDCVLNEVISVFGRRAHEQSRPEQFVALLDQLTELVPFDDITWISEQTQRFYNQVVELVRSSEGELNFHDALIALACRDWDISMLVSFDQDFDQIDWLTRVGNATQIAEILQHNAEAGG